MRGVLNAVVDHLCAAARHLAVGAQRVGVQQDAGLLAVDDLEPHVEQVVDGFLALGEFGEALGQIGPRVHDPSGLGQGEPGPPARADDTRGVCAAVAGFVVECGLHGRVVGEVDRCGCRCGGRGGRGGLWGATRQRARRGRGRVDVHAELSSEGKRVDAHAGRADQPGDGCGRVAVNGGPAANHTTGHRGFAIPRARRAQQVVIADLAGIATEPGDQPAAQGVVLGGCDRVGQRDVHLRVAGCARGDRVGPEPLDLAAVEVVVVDIGVRDPARPGALDALLVLQHIRAHVGVAVAGLRGDVGGGLLGLVGPAPPPHPGRVAVLVLTGCGPVRVGEGADVQPAGGAAEGLVQVVAQVLCRVGRRGIVGAVGVGGAC